MHGSHAYATLIAAVKSERSLRLLVHPDPPNPPAGGQLASMPCKAIQMLICHMGIPKQLDTCDSACNVDIVFNIECNVIVYM